MQNNFFHLKLNPDGTKRISHLKICIFIAASICSSQKLPLPTAQPLLPRKVLQKLPPRLFCGSLSPFSADILHIRLLVWKWMIFVWNYCYTWHHRWIYLLSHYCFNFYIYNRNYRFFLEKTTTIPSACSPKTTISNIFWLVPTIFSRDPWY